MVLEKNNLIIDKSLFIKEIIDSQVQVQLIIRQRRFGKTLNMSMLRYFFDQKEKKHGHLFHNLKIWKEGERYRQEQGQYPVIFITFKDIKANSYEEAYEGFQELLADLYKQYKTWFFNGILRDDEDEKKSYQKIINCKATKTATKNALKKLTEYLYRSYGKRVIVLIDEYDTPINHSYIHKYYDPMIEFMRGLLSPTLKDNLALQQAILTGILRVAKESILSGLNNVLVYSLLEETYSSYFGFLEEELLSLLGNFNNNAVLMSQIEKWYGGYQIGSHKIFNPWSTVVFITENFPTQNNNLNSSIIRFEKHWINTSGNELIEELLIAADNSIKENFKKLLKKETISTTINKHIVFSDIRKNPKTLWSFLLLHGYLTVKSSASYTDEEAQCELVIPNRELYKFYEKFVEQWFGSETIEFVFRGAKEDNVQSPKIAGNSKILYQKWKHILNTHQQNGWNCFDIAVGLERQQLVKYAIDNAAKIEFRQLLSPEIKHAVALTAIYMQNKKETSEQETKEMTVRTNRILELFQIAEALKGEREQALVEEQVSQLLIDSNKNSEKQELEQLVRYTLPKAMHTDAICELVNNYYDAHESMKNAVTECNTALGYLEGKRLSLEELDKLFSEPINRKEYQQIYEKFASERIQIFVPAEQRFKEYCESEYIYKAYVDSYYGANQWFAFQRHFAERKETSMVDIGARYLNAQIFIHDNLTDQKIIYHTQPYGTREIHVEFNGRNHFVELEGLSDNNDCSLQSENFIYGDKTFNGQANSTSTKEVIIKRNLQEDAVSLAILSNQRPLPSIPFNRQELQEIIDELPMAADIKAQVKSYVDNIEQNVAAIHQYQSKQNPRSFYLAMQSFIIKIRNTVNFIYELVKPYHVIFPNVLKQLISGWIAPLELELENRLGKSETEREELEVKTKHLYAEQSFVTRTPSIQREFMEHLVKLKQLLVVSGQLTPRCYISYAWPSKENKEKEYWVQPFLSVLYDHLTAAGIRVVMDIRDNKPGGSIYQFMEQYHEDNYIILIGTESLLQKHYSVAPHAVQTELSIILNRFEHEQKQFGQSRIYPLLISGTVKTSYPERFQLYSIVRDARTLGYVGTLRKLMDWVYESSIHKIEPLYLNLWKQFHQDLPRDLGIIDQEIKIGYHRQSLDYLKQDIQYQTIKVQQEVKHSSALNVEMMDVLMKSQKTNPKILYAEYGQQFQRPSINADFIERKKLQEKTANHFAQSEQQILILIACGLGGVGKTALAQEYYLYPSQPYVLRAWFYAENRDNLYQQYMELALVNGIKFLDKMPLEEKAKRVKIWLETQKDCLLVYDNILDMETVSDLLPKQGKHHILMTSRNVVGWPAHQILDVDVMEEPEAISLIRKMTGSQGEEKILNNLVKALGNLPLALAQAGAYMAVKGLNAAEYLERYQKHQDKLLSDSTLARSPKHEPIWVSFDMNFEALKRDCPMALMTLKQASWLNHALIPERLLKTMMDDVHSSSKDLLWDEVKEHIRRYSLMRIDVEQHQLNIHPLLQDILRSRQETTEQVQIFKQMCDRLNELIGYYDKERKFEYQSLLSHAECLHQHGQYIAKLPEVVRLIEFPTLLAVEPKSLGTIYHHMRLDHMGMNFYSQQLDAYKKCHGENHPNIARSYNNLGTALQYLGDAKEAMKYYEKALAILVKVYDPEHPDVATSYNHLGAALRAQGDAKKAVEYFEKALAIEIKVYGSEHSEVALSYNNLGKALRTLGDAKNAVKYHEKALAIFIKIYSPEHLDVAASYSNLGVTWEALGDANKAMEYSEKALAIQIKVYGSEHPDVAASYSNLGVTWEALGDAKKAMEYFEKALAIQIKVYGSEHPDVAINYNNLGRALQDLGDANKAMEYFEKALAIQIKVYGSEHPDVAISYNNLGVTWGALGDANKAMEYSEKALAIQIKVYGLDHPDVAATYNDLGKVWKTLGDTKKAVDYYDRSLAILSKKYNAEHPNIITLLDNRRYVLTDLQKQKASLPTSSLIFSSGLTTVNSSQVTTTQTSPNGCVAKTL